jgi:hypothetical protein
VLDIIDGQFGLQELLANYFADFLFAIKSARRYDSTMSNKRVGRPPKPEAAKQKAALTIRMTEAERERIAKAGGYEPGVWARGVLLREADRILGKTGETSGG